MYFRTVPYVDPNQIYLGGRSTGGTLVMLVGECSDRFRAVFSLEPVAEVQHYGGMFVHCDTNDAKEMALRSPMNWLHCVKSPMYVFEGATEGNWESIELMVRRNSNPNIHFFRISGHDHFSVIAPITEMLASQILDERVDITEESLRNLR